MSKSKKTLCAIGIIVSAIILLHYWVVYFYIPNWPPYFVSTSPDGRFAISAYNNPGLEFRVFSMPGNGSGSPGPGTIVMRDIKTEKVMRRAVAEFVDWFNPEVEWNTEKNTVHIDKIGVWDLPPPENAAP